MGIDLRQSYQWGAYTIGLLYDCVIYCHTEHIEITLHEVEHNNNNNNNNNNNKFNKYFQEQDSNLGCDNAKY